MQPCLRHTLQLPKNKKERRRQERQEEKQARADAVEQRERKTSTHEEQRRAKQDQKEAVRRAQVRTGVDKGVAVEGDEGALGEDCMVQGRCRGRQVGTRIEGKPSSRGRKGCSECKGWSKGGVVEEHTS